MSTRLTCSEMLEDSQGDLDTNGALNRQESSFLGYYRFYRRYFVVELIIGSIFLLSEMIALAIVTYENPDDGYRLLHHQMRSSVPLSQEYLLKDWADFAPQIHRLLQMRELIIAQIVCYAVQLMLQFAAVRTGHRRFYTTMFLPIILNIFICVALVALELTFFCAPILFSFIDLILTLATIKSLS